MRFFWKALLIIIPLGSYWLYKKSSSSASNDSTEQQPRPAKENKTTTQSSFEKDAAAKQGGVSSKGDADLSENKEEHVPAEQIIEQLTEIDGVTSRVAERLVERGITSKKALMKLSEEELRSVKGIGPKRAEKILNSR